MVRIVGVLCGSALAISSLIIALGIPEFLPASGEAPEVMLETVPEPPIETDVEPVAEVVPAAQIDPLPEVAPESIAESTPPPMPNEPTKPTERTQPTEHWYAFWSPFRSELAANGFVAQLQRNTGMDYRVVRVKPGVFEVAFAYEADADIASHLAAISAATGLDMPDG